MVIQLCHEGLVMLPAVCRYEAYQGLLVVDIQVLCRRDPIEHPVPAFLFQMELRSRLASRDGYT